jgi:hypothetical protein
VRLEILSVAVCYNLAIFRFVRLLLGLFQRRLTRLPPSKRSAPSEFPNQLSRGNSTGLNEGGVT